MKVPTAEDRPVSMAGWGTTRDCLIFARVAPSAKQPGGSLLPEGGGKRPVPTGEARSEETGFLRRNWAEGLAFSAMLLRVHGSVSGPTRLHSFL